MDCWAIGRYDLGLTDDEWLRMTPRQLFALQHRRLTHTRNHELMLSRLTAAVYNSGFAHPQTPFNDADFMLHPFPRPEPPEPEPLGDAFIQKLKTVHWAQEAVN